MESLGQLLSTVLLLLPLQSPPVEPPSPQVVISPSPPVVPVQVTTSSQATAKASWYATKGLRNPKAFTFAHLTLPKGTRVEFCVNGKCSVGICTDRGPQAWTGKQFDLSSGLFKSLAPLSQGVLTLQWRRI